MIVNDLLKCTGMTKYRLSRDAHIPNMTVSDICNGKTSLAKCNAETVYQIAKVFGVTVEELLEAAKEQRCLFSVFKSNVCHKLKELGDIDFLYQTLSSDEIRKYYDKGWHPECLYWQKMTKHQRKGLGRSDPGVQAIQYRRK